MFIKTLELKNFRSHQETVLELDRLNFIRGPNSCGKSSVRMALEYLFTGRCELTDAAGRGAEALICTGEGEFVVSAILGGGETMSRRRTRRSQTIEINGRRVTASAAEAFVVQKVAGGDVLSAVLNADKFADMSEVEQRRFLAGLTELGKIDIPEEIRRALATIGEETPRVKNFADVEAASRRFQDLRAETNHALDLLGQPKNAESRSDFGSDTAARGQVGTSRPDTQQTEWPAFRQSDLDCCEKIGENLPRRTETDFDESLFDVPSLWDEDELLRLGSPAEHAKELRRQLVDLTAEQEAVDASVPVMQSLRDRCPTCGQTISEAARASQADRLCGRLAELKDLIQRTRDELSCYGGPGTAVSECRVQGRVLIRPANDLKRCPNVRNSRLVVGEEKFSQSRRGPESVQQQKVATEGWEACERQRSTLKNRLGALEQVIDFFGRQGPITQEAGRRVEQFRRDLDRHLSAFGYACNLTLEPFEMRISLQDARCPLFLRQLSESERFRFGVAFQIALAAITGVRFLIIDRADMLDKERRRLLTALLLRSDVEQAIVLATAEESVPLHVPEGVKFFSLDERFRT